MANKKMRINIWDMPQDVKISRGEMTHLQGGNYLSSPYTSSHISYSRTADSVSINWLRTPLSTRPINPGKVSMK
jgi:hypothetical protein